MAAPMRAMFAGLPDQHFPEDRTRVYTDVERGESVLAWTFTATMTGDIVMPEGRMPATGRKVEVSGTTVNRFRGELLSHFTMYYDSLDFMQQLGFLPETGRLGFKAVVLADYLAGRAKKALHLV